MYRLRRKSSCPYDVGVVMRTTMVSLVPPAVLRFEQPIRTLTHTEESAFFSPTGREVLRLHGLTTGDGFFTVIPEEMVTRLAGCILTHNHPSGCAFTCRDLREAAVLSLAEIRVVTRTAAYSMKPGPDGWPAAETIAERWTTIAHDPVFQADVAARCSACGVPADDWAGCRPLCVDLLCEYLARALHLIYHRDGLVGISEGREY